MPAPPRTALNLTYTGQAQALVVAGSTNDGEMQYSLDGVSYSATIPTGTEAKTYSVWYKVVGDSNHNDTAPANIEVKINPASASPTAPTADALNYTGELQYALGEDADTAPALESFTTTVTVDTNPTKVSISKPSKTMKVGATQNLGAKVKLTPAKAITTLSWKSSNPAVATVDSNGVVTAITVTTSNGKKAKVTIKVK